MKKPSGSKIAGWWAWFPTTASAHARRFETREDAVNYQPGASTKSGPLFPGLKLVMRVSLEEITDEKRDSSMAFVHGRPYGWTHGMVEVFTVEQQREHYLKLLEEDLDGS